MSCVRLQIRSFVAVSLIALGVVFSSTVAPAGKPAGGGGGTIPPAPGIIYFYTGNGSWWTMNGDGSGKASVSGLTISATAPLSSARHAGSRWLIASDYDDSGVLDPWGYPPRELFAVNQSNQWVQLTGDPNIRWDGYYPPAWSKDDSFVSFQGVMNTGTGVVGGIFVVFIDWSTGSPVSLPPILAVPTLLYEDPEWWGWSYAYVAGHDWSPAADKVVYEGYDADYSAHLYVATFTSAGIDTRSLATGTDLTPVFSPDGNRIAFQSGGIWTIKSDGSGAVRLTQYTETSKETRRQFGPTWSPDGAFLAFTEALYKNRAWSSSVHRIPAGGGTAVNLTSELSRASGPQWRP